MAMELTNLSAELGSPFWDVAKIVGPLLTGGLAGSLLTYNLNRRAARKSIPRLKVVLKKVEYSLSAQHRSLKKMSVSYDGLEYDGLTLQEVSLLNVSTKSISATPMLISIGDEAKLIDFDGAVEPIDRDMPLNPVAGKKGMFEWDGGELKPGDSARLSLLIESAGSFEIGWRGDDSVDLLTDGGVESSRNVTRDLQFITMMLAFLIASGSLPFFGPLLQGAIIFGASPYLVGYVSKYFLPTIKSLLGRRGGVVINANAPNANIKVGDRVIRVGEVESSTDV
ncbi:hypothetical protein [Burkholderia cepacia]|uniref:hypothetical protein n=1 Tax=Burkholderia cepacia TaxID=292 RepID=UPI000ABAB451|nr:hypothetical protein [Burkholderia cepacia]